MKFIGIHIGHDATIARFNEQGELDFYAPCERYAPRLKMQGLTLSPIIDAFPNFSIEDGDCVTLVISNDETRSPCEYDPRLAQTCHVSINLKDHGCNPSFVIDHHFAHAVCAWCFRPDDKERLFLCYDGSGPSLVEQPKASIAGVFNKDEAKFLDHVPIPSSVCLFNILGGNSAGKAMGMSGYRPNAPLFVNEKYISKLLWISMNWQEGTMGTPRTEIQSEEDMDFVASFYNFVIEDIWKSIKQNIDKLANGRGVVIGGGTSLALEINSRIFEITKDVVFAPPTNDTGLAIGAAAFSYYHHKKKWPCLDTPSLVSLNKPLEAKGPQTPQGVAELIANGHIVGLLRGKSEAGPRALGYRSILADARNPNNLHQVSQKIKGREFYRPLAPMVTSEQFSYFFDGPVGEYMQYKVQCTEMAKKELPAIVHTDESARPQVVFKNKDPWLHEMLVCYGKLTGHECVINTSLNKAGKPICNTYEDAAEDFPTGLKIVCLPSKKTDTGPVVKRATSTKAVPFQLQFKEHKML